jgi:hypothetical protein
VDGKKLRSISISPCEPRNDGNGLGSRCGVSPTVRCSPVVAIPDELELWARARSLRAYAARDERSKYFVSRMDELRRARHKIARRTRTLRRRIEFLEKEQQNILSVIRLNLASHNEAPSPNDEKIFCRRAKKRVSAGASQVSLMIQ